jgi:hypothetical protein
MRASWRPVAVLAVIIGLLSGLWMPLSARADAAVPDGLCGAQHIAGRTAARLTVDGASAQPGHCLACHLRHDMAGAFVSSGLLIVSPLGSVELRDDSPIDRHDVLLYDDAAPRGPPARS